jgi:hypothetical protein
MSQHHTAVYTNFTSVNLESIAATSAVNTLEVDADQATRQAADFRYLTAIAIAKEAKAILALTHKAFLEAITEAIEMALKMADVVHDRNAAAARAEAAAANDTSDTIDMTRMELEQAAFLQIHADNLAASVLKEEAHERDELAASVASSIAATAAAEAALLMAIKDLSDNSDEELNKPACKKRYAKRDLDFKKMEEESDAIAAADAAATAVRLVVEEKAIADAIAHSAAEVSLHAATIADNLIYTLGTLVGGGGGGTGESDTGESEEEIEEEGYFEEDGGDSSKGLQWRNSTGVTSAIEIERIASETRERIARAGRAAEEAAARAASLARMAADAEREVIVISDDDDQSPIINISSGSEVELDITLMVNGDDVGAIDIRIDPCVTGLRLRLRSMANHSSCPFVMAAGGPRAVANMSKKERNRLVYTPRHQERQLKIFQSYEKDSKGKKGKKGKKPKRTVPSGCREEKKEKKDDDEGGGAGGAANGGRVRRMMKRNAAKESQGIHKRGRKGSPRSCY